MKARKPAASLRAEAALLDLSRGAHPRDPQRWKNVEQWAVRLARNTAGKTCKQLEAAWCRAVPNEDERAALRYDARYKGSEPLHAALALVQEGFYPPPELLLAIADAFDEYVDAEGSLSLEEVFFGKPTKPHGGFAGRIAAKPVERHLLELLAQRVYERGARAKQGVLSLEQACAIAIERMNAGENPETLARAIRRRTRKA